MAAPLEGAKVAWRVEFDKLDIAEIACDDSGKIGPCSASLSRPVQR
jgi:hypothetical protein